VKILIILLENSKPLLLLRVSSRRASNCMQPSYQGHSCKSSTTLILCWIWLVKSESTSQHSSLKYGRITERKEEEKAELKDENKKKIDLKYHFSSYSYVSCFDLLLELKKHNLLGYFKNISSSFAKAIDNHILSLFLPRLFWMKKISSKLKKIHSNRANKSIKKEDIVIIFPYIL